MKVEKNIINEFQISPLQTIRTNLVPMDPTLFAYLASNFSRLRFPAKITTKGGLSI